MNSMLRTIVSVIAGYAVMAGALMALFTVAYLALGAEWSFKPDSWEPSARWLFLSIGVGLVAAFAGGLIAQRIDSSGKGAMVLLGLIIVLGFGMAIIAGTPEVLGPRTVASPSNFEAMRNAVQPQWMNYLNPVLGCIGVFMATKVLRKR